MYTVNGILVTVFIFIRLIIYYFDFNTINFYLFEIIVRFQDKWQVYRATQ